MRRIVQRLPTIGVPAGLVIASKLPKNQVSSSGILLPWKIINPFRIYFSFRHVPFWKITLSAHFASLVSHFPTRELVTILFH